MQDFISPYRASKTIAALARQINKESKSLKEKLHIMEVCGGHTHTLMKYGLKGLIDSEKIDFIHGPGCPVCIMPKARIEEAYELALTPGVILLTLGDMMRVPGKSGSLADARAKGAEVDFVYSPLDSLAIARKNPDKKVVFFALGFETTTPMTAALLERAINEGVKNLYFHINHVLVPPPLKVLLEDERCKIGALIAPSHVSVISGSDIYRPLCEEYGLPVVIGGFEPVDMLDSVLRLVRQRLRGEAIVETQYARAVSPKGNLKAQELVKKYFEVAPSFVWRGLGEIKESSLRLRPEFANMDAKAEFGVEVGEVKEDKHCLCGEILRGLAKPKDCRLFGKGCIPSRPIGSCMVSSEGACAAYYKYG